MSHFGNGISYEARTVKFSPFTHQYPRWIAPAYRSAKQIMGTEELDIRLSSAVDLMSREPPACGCRAGFPKKPTPQGVPEDMLIVQADDREERGTNRMSHTKAPRNKPPLDPESESWRKLPWRKFEQQVYRLQKRIFRASLHGKTQVVHKLQKLLTRIQSCPLSRGTKSDARQPGQEHCRGGWGESRAPEASKRTGRANLPETMGRQQTQTSTTSLDTKTGQSGKAWFRDARYV